MNLVKLQDTKSIHRNHFLFYILTMEKSEREIKTSIPFTIVTQRIKYLGINLPKETKELYIENSKETIRKLLELISEYSSHGIQDQYREITCIPTY